LLTIKPKKLSVIRLLPLKLLATLQDLLLLKNSVQDKLLLMSTAKRLLLKEPPGPLLMTKPKLPQQLQLKLQELLEDHALWTALKHHQLDQHAQLLTAA
jgi:hypothetical protein